MNDMLAGIDWMSTIKPDDDGYVLAHITWLKTATPDEWHRVVLDFNWSNRLDPLLWIVMQDDCDMATALTLFWKCAPGWDLMLLANGERVRERDEAAIIKVIADRISAGAYKRRKIAFDAEPQMLTEFEEMRGYCARIAEPPFDLHLDLIRSRRGREVFNDAAFYRRYPEAFHGSVMIELPEWDGSTPGMDVAAKELRSVIVNIGIVGAALYMVRFIDWQSMTHLAGVAILAWGLFLQLRDSSRSAATIRSLMRENGNSPSRLGHALLGGAALAAGYGLFKLGIKSYFALTGAGMIYDPAGYGKIGAVLLSTGALWGSAWLVSRVLVRRVLFR